MLDLLTECKLLFNMTDNEKNDCIRDFSFTIREYKRGEVIAFAGDEVKDQLILVKGSVKNEMTDFNGKTIKIADMEAPKLLAPAFIFADNNTYPISVIAKENCEIMFIRKSQLIYAIGKNEKLQSNFLKIISNQVQFLVQKINFLNFKTIKGKIAFYLLIKYKKTNSINIELNQSQTQLADLFGVTRPSLSRAMNQMAKNRIINIDRKNIEILDLSRLKGLLE